MTPDELLDRISQQVADENSRYQDLCDLVWAAICTYSQDEWPDVDDLVIAISHSFEEAGYPNFADNSHAEFENAMGRKCPDPYNTYDEETEHHA
jgi:hypothetical protein